MKTAFLYPGQGSQEIGMGVSVANHFPEALAVFDCASSLAGYDMLSLCAEGTIEKLSRTCYTQPALYTVEAAITDVLKGRGIKPSYAAGHSLGEFGAWYAADVYSFEDGFWLVSERGRIMEQSDPDGNGTMCAVIGLTQDVVMDVCSCIDGTIVVANINSPQQIVISGEKKSLEKAEPILKEKGAKRIVPLKVSGAFHSPMMEKACAEFAEVIEEISLSDAEIPVYTNVSAKPVTDVEEIRDAMILQLTSPVRWTETVKRILSDGACKAFEIGPRNVIAGLMKRIDDSFTIKSISNSSTILEVLREETKQ